MRERLTDVVEFLIGAALVVAVVGGFMCLNAYVLHWQASEDAGCDTGLGLVDRC